MEENIRLSSKYTDKQNHKTNLAGRFYSAIEEISTSKPVAILPTPNKGEAAVLTRFVFGNFDNIKIYTNDLYTLETDFYNEEFLRMEGGTYNADDLHRLQDTVRDFFRRPETRLTIMTNRKLELDYNAWLAFLPISHYIELDRLNIIRLKCGDIHELGVEPFIIAENGHGCLHWTLKDTPQDIEVCTFNQIESYQNYVTVFNSLKKHYS